MLYAIQWLHTLIAVWNIGCLLYMNVCHVLGRWSRFLAIAYTSIAIEAIAILPFGFVCPIRLLVDRWYSPATPDILVPYAIAVWIMPVGLLLFATAIAAAVGRFYFATRRQTD